MMTSRIHIEHKRRSSWSNRAVVGGLTLSLTNYFGAKLGLESIVADTPVIRQ
jgi:hypothetical protein